MIIMMINSNHLRQFGVERGGGGVGCEGGIEMRNAGIKYFHQSDECMDECMDGCMDECMDGCMDECMDGWMDGWMHGWMHG